MNKITQLPNKAQHLLTVAEAMDLTVTETKRDETMVHPMVAFKIMAQDGHRWVEIIVRKTPRSWAVNAYVYSPTVPDGNLINTKDVIPTLETF